MVPALETIDSAEELKAAVEDPMAKLEEMADASKPLALKLAIMRLKPKLEPLLRKQGLEWADVVPVLESIDSVEELKAAVADPGAFAERLGSAGALAAKTQAEDEHSLADYRQPPVYRHSEEGSKGQDHGAD